MLDIDVVFSVGVGVVAYVVVAGNPSIGYGATTIDGRKVTMRDICTKNLCLIKLHYPLSLDLLFLFASRVVK